MMISNKAKLEIPEKFLEMMNLGEDTPFIISTNGKTYKETISKMIPSSHRTIELQTAEITHDTDSDLAESIERRYKLLPENYDLQEFIHRLGIEAKKYPDKVLIIDSLIPTILYRTLAYSGEFGHFLGKLAQYPNVYTLSKLFAKTYNLNYLPIARQLQLIDFIIDDVDLYGTRDNLLYSNSIMADIVGLGGTMGNVLSHWSNLIKASPIGAVRHKINIDSIYEYDRVDFHNLIRYSGDVDTTFFQYFGDRNYASTVDFVNESDTLNVVEKLRKDNLSPINQDYKQSVLPYKIDLPFVYNSRDNANLFRYKFNTYHLSRGGYKRYIIGTPDLQTRQELHEFNYKKFICPVVRDNKVDILFNPEIDSAIQYESYGQLDLTMFNLNTLKLAMELWKLVDRLKDGELPKQSISWDMGEITSNNNKIIKVDLNGF